MGLKEIVGLGLDLAVVLTSQFITSIFIKYVTQAYIPLVYPSYFQESISNHLDLQDLV